MQIEMIRVEDLIPYENNPRRNDEAVEKVAASIREFGFKVPIIIDKDNVIVAGHTRLKAAELLGLDKVPVIRADDLSEEQVRAFRLADNKTGELASWDFELLDLELEDLDGFDMSEFGFETDDHDDYVDDFFDRGVEAKEKTVVLGVKVVCGTKQQVEECMALLKEAGYNPEEL